VLGWEPSPVDMGGYADFNMTPRGSRKPAAGVCHARDANADLPAQWLIYVPVKNLATSMRACKRLGGKVLRKTKSFCLIQDPAGAVMMLWETK
jgi:predicted enzyme related to lactoylglutathione lyase